MERSVARAGMDGRWLALLERLQHRVDIEIEGAVELPIQVVEVARLPRLAPQKKLLTIAQLVQTLRRQMRRL